MVEYGYMDGNCLHSRFIEPIARIRIGEDGNKVTETVSVEQQVAELSPEWKPVDTIDEAQMESGDENYIIVPVPYDAGDHIAYNYVRKFDIKRVRTEIEALKESLSQSDYRITKCYEATLLGQPLPYDINALHTERQKARDRINELETQL
ncbi:MAG: hypothetical protein [Bacteriophage sp.]|jgi:hypothetical protein|nr:MAG: hypothetical protein [Bacteriophage sp.]